VPSYYAACFDPEGNCVTVLDADSNEQWWFRDEAKAAGARWIAEQRSRVPTPRSDMPSTKHSSTPDPNEALSVTPRSPSDPTPSAAYSDMRRAEKLRAYCESVGDSDGVRFYTQEREIYHCLYQARARHKPCKL